MTRRRGHAIVGLKLLLSPDPKRMTRSLSWIEHFSIAFSAGTPEAQSEPVLCKATPTSFYEERTSFIDEPHREFVRRALKEGYDERARAKLLREMQRQIVALAKKNPYEAAI